MEVYKTRDELLNEWQQKGRRLSDEEQTFLRLTDEEKSVPETFEAFCESNSGGMGIVLSSEEMRDNHKLMLIAAKNGVGGYFYLMSERLRDDPEIALYAAETGNPSAHTCLHISKRLRDDPEFVLKALQVSSYIYKYASDRAKTDPSVLLYVAENQPHQLVFILKIRKVKKEIREKILHDKKIILAVAHTSPEILYTTFPKQYLKDPDIIEAAFRISDKNACKRILKENPWAFEYVPSEIWHDDEKLIVAALKKNGLLLKNLPEKYSTQKQYALLAVQSMPTSLKYVSNNLKDDKDVVLAAINTEDSEGVLEYASSRLRDDYDLVYKAVSVDALNLEFASDRLRDDKTIVMAALKKFGGVLEDASERLQKDPELIKLAAENS